MNRRSDIRDAFRQLVAAPQEEWDLTAAGFLVARTRYPALDPSGYLGYLEGLAESLRESVRRDAPARTPVEELNRIFFQKEGFTGNHEHYYDPDNSFLNRVVDRKLGIPISLGLLYIEVGKRAGLQLDPIAAPGHFLVSVRVSSEPLFIDPFNQGQLMSQDECRQVVRSRIPKGRSFEPSWLEPANNGTVLTRLLRNLKALYLNANNPLKGFEMVDWILTADPEALAERRERGLLYESMGNIPKAVADLEYYLARAPQGGDTGVLRSKLEALRSRTFTMH